MIQVELEGDFPMEPDCIIDGREIFSRICHVPNFALGQNGLITFSIFMRVFQIDAKG